MLKDGPNARRLTARGLLFAACLLILPMALAFAGESRSSADRQVNAALESGFYDMNLVADKDKETKPAQAAKVTVDGDKIIIDVECMGNPA